MVIRRTINDLKDRPREDRLVVATGIALTVVAILLAGWAFAFLRGMQSTSQDQTVTAPPDSSDPSDAAQVQQAGPFASTTDAASAQDEQDSGDPSASATGY